MEHAQFKVMIVDDSPTDIKLVMECLKDKYLLTAATTGEKALAIAETSPPDIVLMDVSMPIMNGYDTCRALLKSRPTNIIFLSANNSTDEIMQGYDAGGIDYITKPFDPVVLHEKIEFALNSKKLSAQAVEREKQSDEIDTLRLILDFNLQCLTVQNMQQLATKIVSTCETFHLDCCVQLHSHSGIFEAKSCGTVSKLESEILTRILQEEGREFQHKHGLFVTFDNIALLVKNLPDSGQHSMKTSLANLIENANTMLLHLDRIHSLKQSNNQAEQAVLEDLSKHLSVIQDQLALQKNHKKESVKIVDEVLANMESSFVDMGLTYNQEQALLAILHAGIDRSIKHFEMGSGLDEHFEAVIRDVSTLLEIHK